MMRRMPSFVAILLVATIALVSMGTSYAADPVQVQLYYESMCPYCQQFITTSLFKAMSAIPQIIDLQMFPYGNAKETKNADGSWSFSCQHGVLECAGNLAEACVLAHTGFNSSIYFPVVECMEASNPANPAAAGPSCASKFGINYGPILTCISSAEGNAIQHEFAVDTNELNPPHQGVPWILINGDANQQDEAYDDLISVVCKNYSGEKPAACPQ